MTDTQWVVFTFIHAFVSCCVITTVASIVDYTMACFLKDKKLGNTRGSLFVLQALLTIIIGATLCILLSFELKKAVVGVI